MKSGMLRRNAVWWVVVMMLAVFGVLAGASVLAQTPEVAAPAATAAAPAVAPAAPTIDKGDTAWILISSALVLFMTPGLAFFYGGLVRKKNVLSLLMQCFMIMCIISIQWSVFGYSLAFGPDKGGFIGGLDWFGLSGVGMDPSADYMTSVPHQAFMVFQMMFAIITPALILGAIAERIKFSSLCVFVFAWATVVYDPIAHWVWGKGGFIGVLGGWGALDFAGGTVVHISAGAAALAGIICTGKRLGFPNKISPPHNLPFAVLGAGILWFGWFGFNAGSAGSANGVAASAFVMTQVATAAAGFGWALLDWVFNGKPTVLGMITGAVAGLVAITPAAGFVTLPGALAIGFTVSVVCYFAVAYVKPRLGYDDSLDVVGVHMIGGMWGALMTGIFATPEMVKAAAAGDKGGLLYGNPMQLVIQIKAVLLSFVWSFVLSIILYKVIDMVMGLRVSEQAERIGLDLTDHKESAYTLVD
jgi:ammonium transporter, Amt family